MLFKKLQEMEAADPSLVTEDSPTQCVGGKSAEIHMKMIQSIHMRQNGFMER
jgi:NAD-dependent DNA ligase